MNLKKFINKEILNMSAYQPSKFIAKIKLDANESPFNLPPELRKELAGKIIELAFNRYPDPESAELKKKIGKWLRLKEDQILMGNGSDELIKDILVTFGGVNRTIAVPTPTFVMYKIIALSLGYKVVEIPLDKEWDLDLKAFSSVISKDKPGLIFLSSPNNPTGNSFSFNRIEAIIKKSKGIVVVDEAYGNFSARSFLPLLEEYKNLIVLRTLSKIGFASLRLGIMAASNELIFQQNKVRLPYNVSLLSQTAANFILDNMKIIKNSIKQIILERNNILKELKSLDSLDAYPSDSNFILFKVLKGNGNKLFNRLLESGILVKNFSNSSGALNETLRVTVGTPQENSTFIRCIKKWSKEQKD